MFVNLQQPHPSFLDLYQSSWVAIWGGGGGGGVKCSRREDFLFQQKLLTTIVCVDGKKKFKKGRLFLIVVRGRGTGCVCG